MKALILLTMIFLHIVDDFYLQGILAKMKTKAWWKDQHGSEKRDYIAALIIHGFSWSFMVHLPFMGLIVLCDLFGYSSVLVLSMIIHAVLHAIIDHEKANNHWLDFTDDQLLHMSQIAVIWTTAVLALFKV